MSTLVIEGGHRLEGRVDVEGNKNAALPLMAACLLTDEPCTLHQRAAHRRRRGHGAAAARSRRRGRGHRQHDAAHPLPRGHEGRARQRARRPAARIGAAAGPAAGAHAAARSSRRRAATSRRGAPSDPPRGAGRHGRARARRHRPSRSKRRTGSSRRRSTSTRRRSPAPKPRCSPRRRRHGVSEIRHAACEPHVVELCEFLRGMGVGIEGEGSHTIRVEGVAAPATARRRRSTATTSRRAVGRWSPRSPAATSRSAARGPVDMEVVAATLNKMHVQCAQDGDVFRVEPSHADRRGPHHDRPVAGVSERPRQPGHGAGDAGRRRHARARLAVRTAAVRARADERHGRRPVPLRSASHHRHRPAASCAASRSTAAISDRAWR